MLFEVYTGAKPGRPGLLVIATGALLASALGLAWFQVHTTAGLGPEQRIGNTPLWVRLPRGWQVDPRNPGRFVLPIAEHERRTTYEFERQIQFEYVRLPSFVSLETLLHLPVLSGSGKLTDVSRTRLGPYPAVEIQKLEPRRVGRLALWRETITRFTCLPRGQVIKVVYEPLEKLRPTDQAILEEVCASLRLDGPTLSGPPAEFLRCAGLKLPLDPQWQVVGTEFEETPGVYIGGLDDGIPGWSLAVFRTWLASGRTPRDLLADFAARNWLLWEVSDAIREQTRADGATVAAIQHPQFGRADPVIPSAWVVAQSPSRAAIIFVLAGPKEAAAADRAAARVAADLDLEPLAAIPDVETAEAAGRALVEDLTRAGPAARWGREPVATTYRREGSDERVIVERGAIERDPNRGYEGAISRATGRTQREGLRWTLDARAGAYTWQSDLFHGTSQVRVEERRATPDGEVSRQVYVDERRTRRARFTPGPGFVPPPAAAIIRGWVARQDQSPALVSESSELGPATHTVLLRHLAPEGTLPRVLAQEDFWPFGSIEAYNDSRAETEYEMYPDAEYRRVK
jgi:hypothetical protein